MLSGTYEYNIDAKGRLNFPARLREELGTTFIVAKSLMDPCLTVYSMTEWEKLVEKVEALPMGKGRGIKRQLFASAVEVTPDKQGRILIPQTLTAFANLSKEATILGVSKYCEIWDKDAWDAQLAEQSVEAIADAVLELDL